MTRKHTHKNTKKAQQKGKGNWEAGRGFFYFFLFFHFFGLATLVTNISFFFLFLILHFFDIENLAKAHPKNSKT
jgi:hypothetical protein